MFRGAISHESSRDKMKFCTITNNRTSVKYECMTLTYIVDVLGMKVCVCLYVLRGGQSSIKVRMLKKWKCPNPQTSISVLPGVVGFLFYLVF